MDVLDFVTSLAKGDVVGVVWNLIPMIGDVVKGFCRIARKGDNLYNIYKASYLDMTDITHKIDELEVVAREIAEQRRNIDYMAKSHPLRSTKFSNQFRKSEIARVEQNGITVLIGPGYLMNMLSK